MPSVRIPVVYGGALSLGEGAFSQNAYIQVWVSGPEDDFSYTGADVPVSYPNPAFEHAVLADISTANPMILHLLGRPPMDLRNPDTANIFGDFTSSTVYNPAMSMWIIDRYLPGDSHETAYVWLTGTPPPAVNDQAGLQAYIASITDGANVFPNAFSLAIDIPFLSLPGAFTLPSAGAGVAVSGNWLQTGALDDVLTGTGLGDWMVSGAGADTLLGGDGADQMMAQGGDDWLMGGAGDDTMAASDGNDLLFGGEGDDSMGGGFGNDVVYGGNGRDVIGGGPGEDLVDAGWGNDTLSGGWGRDALYGGPGSDQMAGSYDADLIYGGDEADQIDGGPGDDIGGGSGSDTIYGGTGNDTVGAGTDDDFVYGGAGDDVLGGADGADHLWGDAGADILRGGAGDDTLTGGDGADEFRFVPSWTAETDHVTDFQTGIDHLSFAGVASFAALTITQGAGGAQIGYGAMRVVLDGVLASALGADDVLLV